MKNQTQIRSRAMSCFVVRKHQGVNQTLLMKRVGEPLDGQWCQVAGRLEGTETAWQAAIRELKEETNLEPSRLYAAGICEQFYVWETDNIILIPVFVAFVAPEAQVRLNEEHSAFEWLDFKAARARLPFATQHKTLDEVEADFVTTQPNPLLHIPLAAAS